MPPVDFLKNLGKQDVLAQPKKWSTKADDSGPNCIMKRHLRDHQQPGTETAKDDRKTMKYSYWCHQTPTDSGKFVVRKALICRSKFDSEHVFCGLRLIEGGQDNSGWVCSSLTREGRTFNLQMVYWGYGSAVFGRLSHPARLLRRRQLQCTEGFSFIHVSLFISFSTTLSMLWLTSTFCSLLVPQHFEHMKAWPFSCMKMHVHTLLTPLSNILKM